MTRLRKGLDYIKAAGSLLKDKMRKPLKDGLLEQQRQLRRFMLTGRAADAGRMLAEEPSLIAYFAERFATERSLGNESFLYNKALECLAEAAAEPKEGESMVMILADLLSHREAEVKIMAALALRTAAKHADIKPAVPALQKSISGHMTAREATAALTLHHLKTGNKEGIRKLLGHANDVIKACTAATLGAEAAEGDGSALSRLVAGCYATDDKTREACAKELTIASHEASGDAKREIDFEIEGLRAENSVVRLDVVKEILRMEGFYRRIKKD